MTIDPALGPGRTVSVCHCGLCDHGLSGESWEEHQASAEHRANLRNEALLAERLLRYRTHLPTFPLGRRSRA
jgi:hypothetical protein